MAQGAPKGPKTKPTSGGRKKGGTMQKGKRDIPPKSTHKLLERAQKKVSSFHLHLSHIPHLTRKGGWRGYT
jgi:hypothetical protein